MQICIVSFHYITRLDDILIVSNAQLPFYVILYSHLGIVTLPVEKYVDKEDEDDDEVEDEDEDEDETMSMQIWSHGVNFVQAP